MVYQGGKSRYAKYIIPILQKTIDENNITTFVDGCCGGCNIIDKIKCQNRIAIDNNKYLIALYNYVVRGGNLPKETPSREMFHYVKEHQKEIKDWYIGLVGIFASFNARGFSGGYGATINGKREVYQERLRNFKRQIPNLQNVQFICKDINEIEYQNCLIYLDPPYKNTQAYDTSKNFNYSKFWDTCRRLSRDNFVFISEQTAPDDFEIIWHKEVERRIKNNKKKTEERLYIWKKHQIF